MNARRFKVELSCQPVKKDVAWPFSDGHRAVSLNITVAAHWTESRSGFSNLPAQQHQVDDLLNVTHCILVLRKDHGTAENCAPRIDENSRGGFDFRLGHTTLFEKITPVNSAQSRGKLFKAGRVSLKELMIQDVTGTFLFFGEDLFHDALQQRHVAIDAHLKKKVCERRSLTQQVTDRKSTRLNSSHGYISYAVFCLKKKNKNRIAQ